MPFDWFTIVAQCINFSILLWLLKRFLYQPILNGLDAREQRLKNVLEQANLKKSKAEQLIQAFHEHQQELQQQRASILKKAHQEASEERQSLFDSAQKAADDMLSKRLVSLQRELQDLQHEVLNRNVEEVYAISTKILTELAGTDLQKAMLDKFLVRLEDLEEEQKDTFLSALVKANNVVLVCSAFEFSEQDRTEIIQALQKLFIKQDLPALELRFKQIPDLVVGMELSVSGWKLAWSINHYMQSLHSLVLQSIQIAKFQHKDKPHQVDHSLEIDET
jgi:F-type H+-transporting ATPase subunit b